MVLDNVDFTTSGRYRCEVSGDAPMFQTDSIEGVLFVVGKSSTLRVKNGYCFTFGDLRMKQANLFCYSIVILKVTYHLIGFEVRLEFGKMPILLSPRK